MQKEVDVHYRIDSAGKHPNVLGVLGDLQGPNGERMIVLPLAPKGDSHELGMKMREGLNTGKLTLDEARPVAYTMLKDVGGSLQHLHDKAGVLHLDLKSENYLVDGEGRLKVMDFGTARPGLEHTLTDYPVESYNYLAPETAKLYARKSLGDPGIGKQIDDLNKDLRELRRQKPQPEEAIKTKQGEVNRLRTEQQKIKDEVRFPVDRKNDSWAMGIMAFGLLVDSGPMGNPFVGENSSVTKDRLLEFGSSGKPLLDQVKEWRPELAGRIDKLTESEKSLINGLLHSDPKQRITVDQAMGREPLGSPGVGNEEARRKLVELTGR
jgi:serine/threonine protein kinase